MAQVDVRRGTTGVLLPAAVSGEIWSNVLETSAVMQAAGTITLPGAGLSIPMITGEPTANWVLETSTSRRVSPICSRKSRNFLPADNTVFALNYRNFSSLPGAYIQKLTRPANR